MRFINFTDEFSKYAKGLLRNKSGNLETIFCTQARQKTQASVRTVSIFNEACVQKMSIKIGSYF